MIVAINKPAGPTSHDIVDGVRKITGEKRVGHGGTLDPFAEGVLVVAIGREYTKKLGDLLKNTDKEYVAVMELGKKSTTGDPEGEITETAGKNELARISENSIADALKKFTGEIEQAPPKYSAIKVGGVPAYDMARRGEEFTLPKRKITIKELELVEYAPPIARVRAVVSSGTYMRSLAEDIGDALGVGAYLKGLTRTRVGNFSIEDSKSIDEFKRDYGRQSGL